MCRVHPTTDVVVLREEPILRGLAALAQLVERLTRNEKVAGSIPAGGSTGPWV